MKEIKQLDAAGLAFIAKEEGCVLKPYRDAVGIPTIGIGSTYWENGKRVQMTDKPITIARAIELFKTVVKSYETAVWSVTHDHISQSQFNALVSLAFNIGVQGFKGSTLLKRINADAKPSLITESFEAWRWAGKRPLLLGRRKREVALYFS